MSRCTGHCCRRFPLPRSLDYIKKHATFELTLVHGGQPIEDGEFIADMLVDLREVTPRPNPTERDPDNHWFTCRHLDDASGDCTAYERRPHMCSEYPYGQACKIEGCTADGDVGLVRIGVKLQ